MELSRRTPPTAEEWPDETERLAASPAATTTSATISGDLGDVEPELLFRWLNPRYPRTARLRFAKLYWRAWHRVMMSFFLFMFGTTFVVIGLACMRYCDEFDRGVAFFVIGLLQLMPGAYGSTILFFYLRGHRGYSYKLLPDMN